MKKCFICGRPGVQYCKYARGWYCASCWQIITSTVNTIASWFGR